MYVTDLVGWYVVAATAMATWRIGVKRLARRTWRRNHSLHGRHKDEVAVDGVTGTAPDDTTTFIPWSALAGVRETERAFLLAGKGGTIRVSLPKRGLHDPALAASLHDFLHRAIDLKQSAAHLAQSATAKPTG